jgi:hypothetical protein
LCPSYHVLTRIAPRSVVESASADGAWVALSPSLRGRLASLDASSSAADAARFSARFAPGAVLTCRVLAVDAPKRHVDLSTRAATADDDAALSRAGATFPGRVVRVVPAVGLYVQLPAHRSGRVALTGAPLLPALRVLRCSVRQNQNQNQRLRFVVLWFRCEDENCPIAVLFTHVRMKHNPLRSTERNINTQTRKHTQCCCASDALSACACIDAGSDTDTPHASFAPFF